MFFSVIPSTLIIRHERKRDNEGGSKMTVEVTCSVHYPFDWIDNSQAPTYSNYQQWVNAPDFVSEGDLSIPRSISISISHTIQKSTGNGRWNNVYVVLSKAARVRMPLLNASFTGALLGGIISSLCLHVLDQPRSSLTMTMATIARSMGMYHYPSLHLNDPHSSTFDFSRIYFQEGEQHLSVSVNKMNNLTVERFIQREVDEIFKLPRALFLSVHEGLVPIKCAFASLFDAKRDSISVQDPEDFSASDAPWLNSLFTARGVFRIGYAFNHWVKPLENDGAVLVGCGGTINYASNIWGRTKTLGTHLQYLPKGLDVFKGVYAHKSIKDPVADGINCVFECVIYHLRHNCTNDQKRRLYLTEDQFLNLDWVKERMTMLLSLEDDFATLAKLTKLAIIATIVDENVKGVKRLHPDIIRYTRVRSFNMKGDMTGEKPLFLFIYPTMRYTQNCSPASVGVYHAVLLNKMALYEKVLCGKCKKWLAYPDSVDYSLQKDSLVKNKHFKHFDLCKECPKCGLYVKVDGSHHLSCRGVLKAAERLRFSQRMQVMPLGENEEETMTSNQWFADFECFPDSAGNHIPYLVVLKLIGAENEPKVFFGEDALKDFVEEILSSKVYGYLWFHNGSGYDATLLLRGLLTYGGDKFEDCVEILRRGTRILTAEIKTRPRPLKLRDFFLFIPAGLARLCGDFKVPGHSKKGAFDHNKIKSFLDARLHMEEVVEYCTKDVLALEFIYTAFSKALYDISPVPMCSKMSLASQAFEMWKQLEDKEVIEQVFIPGSMAEYNIFKSMYHGGRVVPTVARYDSDIWKFGGANPYDADQGYDDTSFLFKGEMEGNAMLDTTVKMLDVVSLYPSVMLHKLYPIGKCIIFGFPSDAHEEAEAKRIMQIVKAGGHSVVAEENDHQQSDTDDESGENDMFPTKKARGKYHVRIEHEEYNKLKGVMMRSCYQVDIHPTFPFLIAFLIRKNDETGSPEQTLAPLKDYWVTGPELFEAIRLGYCLTRVRRIIRWPTLAPLFSNYIKKLFDIKEANKKDKSSSLYIASKLLMNALSGKFGQRVVNSKTMVVRELPDPEDSAIKGLKNLSIEEVEEVITSNLRNIQNFVNPTPVGYIVSGEKSSEEVNPTLPIYLSMMILAHSRVKMSKVLRAMDGYHNPNNCLLYTDTDSLIIRQGAYERLKAARGGRYLGHGLGQLEDEFPDDHIVAARFLAPKTYCLAMLKKVPGGFTYALKVRCKGIPHRGDVFTPLLDYDPTSSEARLALMDESITGPVTDLRERFYIITDTVTAERVSVKYLDIEVFTMLLEKEMVFEVHFGSIVRNKAGPFILTSKWVHRSIGKLSWWTDLTSCSRKLMDEKGEVTSMCKGYESKEMPIQDLGFNQDDLMMAMVLEEMQVNEVDFLL